MKNEFLIASGTTGKRARKNAKAREQAPVEPVTGRFIAILVFVSFIFVGLGAWRVNSVFSLRDDEMETRRLQDLAAKGRDRYKALTSRMSSLRRADVLKTTAQSSLGMAVPEPQNMETITISTESNDRWLAAAGIALPESAEKEVN